MPLANYQGCVGTLKLIVKTRSCPLKVKLADISTILNNLSESINYNRMIPIRNCFFVHQFTKSTIHSLNRMILIVSKVYWFRHC